jgi:hypothetical protein
VFLSSTVAGARTMAIRAEWEEFCQLSQKIASRFGKPKWGGSVKFRFRLQELSARRTCEVSKVAKNG